MSKISSILESLQNPPRIGDLRITISDRAEYEIELYSTHLWQSILWTNTPFWAVPDWVILKSPELDGPFKSVEEAKTAIQEVKKKNNGHLPQYI